MNRILESDIKITKEKVLDRIRYRATLCLTEDVFVDPDVEIVYPKEVEEAAEDVVKCRILGKIYGDLDNKIAELQRLVFSVTMSSGSWSNLDLAFRRLYKILRGEPPFSPDSQDSVGYNPSPDPVQPAVLESSQENHSNPRTDQ